MSERSRTTAPHRPIVDVKANNSNGLTVLFQLSLKNFNLVK